MPTEGDAYEDLLARDLWDLGPADLPFSDDMRAALTDAFVAHGLSPRLLTDYCAGLHMRGPDDCALYHAATVDWHRDYINTPYESCYILTWATPTTTRLRDRPPLEPRHIYLFSNLIEHAAPEYIAPDRWWVRACISPALLDRPLHDERPREVLSPDLAGAHP